MNDSAGKTITMIRSQPGWQLINFKELVEYRDLLYFLVLRGMKAKYAQSVLGIGWAIIQPLFTTIVFTVIFGKIAGVASEGVPYFLFSLTAMIPWNYFANSLTESTNSLVANANMISKVYFPRLILPLSSAFSKIIDFIIGLVVLVIFLLIYKFEFTADILLLPLLVAILLMTSLGLGMLLSAMAVQYRDVKYAMSFLTQILMYLAPVVYATSSIPEKFRIWYALNPMVGVIEGFRAIFLHTQPVPWNYIIEASLVSSVVFFLGTLYFRKMERIFADVV